MRKANSDFIYIVLVGATLTTLLVLAVFLVNRESSGALASDAGVAVLSESTMSAAAGVLNATNFAVVLAVNEARPSLVDEARRGTENAASELRARLGRLTSALPPSQVTSVQEAHGRFELTTDAALEALGSIDNDEGVEVLADQDQSYEYLTQLLAGMRDTRAAKILVAGEGVGRAANAVRFLVVVLLPLGLMLAVWRATRRTAAQRLLTEELRHAKEVSRSKDAFIADVSHELRTPLTGIYGFASALEDERDELPESARELVGLIVTESAELWRMVDDLVAAGRLDAGALEYEIEPVELCSEIEEVVRPFLRQGISVEVDDFAITAIADRARLRQLLRNLVSNAAKHGGDEIAMTAYSRDGMAVIEIIDDGPGVSADVEERLFDRYIHSDGTALLEGSVGLGLAIARSFAEGMGGALDYDRTADLTVFSVTLPLSSPAETPVPETELLSVLG
ncbi:MAG TPA: HAMP domain-containing sensor histidine kinase [Acidimicrobiia bacterium]|nr:HAMP domain-containing sensor histidine kinase [Acidimicrobiia bacterium]